MFGRFMKNDLERMWKVVAMVNFKILSWYLCGGTQENHKNLNGDITLPCQDVNMGPEYDAGC
jgi:hypothetical protein